MSKRFTKPKRVIDRIMHGLASYSGTNGFVTVRSAGDPATLVRTLIQAVVLTVTEQAGAQTIQIELWRKTNAVGSVLPTMDLAGDVPYSDEDDLIWKARYTLVYEAIGSPPIFPINIDMKGARKFSRHDDMVLRFGGVSTIFIDGMLTAWFKEA